MSSHESSRAFRRPLILSLVLALAGFALAAQLTFARATASSRLLCTATDPVGCDVVATSGLSLLFGVPLPVWGLLAFGALAALAASGLARDRPHAHWPAGLLFAGGASAALISTVLAVASRLSLPVSCLLCASVWAVSGGLFALGWRIVRAAGGVPKALQLDLVAVRERPRRTVVLVLTMVGGVAFLVVHAALRS
jgi:uncharacterized membrane protein